VLVVVKPISAESTGVYACPNRVVKAYSIAAFGSLTSVIDSARAVGSGDNPIDQPVVDLGDCTNQGTSPKFTISPIAIPTRNAYRLSFFMQIAMISSIKKSDLAFNACSIDKQRLSITVACVEKSASILDSIY